FTRPLLADDGTAVFQMGNQIMDDPVKHIPPSSIVTQRVGEDAKIIVSKSSSYYSWQFPGGQARQGFVRLGRNPGIGSDGNAVAFMGSQVVKEVQPNGTIIDRLVDGIFLRVPYGSDGTRRMF